MIYVIFDVDGTLLYSNRIDSLCFASTYEQIYEQPFPSIDWRTYPHVTDTTIFNTVIARQFGRQVEEEELLHFQAIYIKGLQAARIADPGQFREVPGAGIMIDYLLGHPDYRVGIGTGGWAGPAQVKLAHIGVPHEALVLSGADGQPTREGILQRAIAEGEKKWGTPDRIVYIGDAIWDVQTTRNLQLNFVGIRRENDHELLYESGAGIVLTDYSDQKLFLDALTRAEPPKNSLKI